MLTLESIVRREPRVVFAEVDGLVALLDPSNNLYRSLNTTASAIWRHLKQDLSVAELAALLGDQFEVSADRCVTTTLAFLTTLVEARLLTVQQ